MGISAPFATGVLGDGPYAFYGSSSAVAAGIGTKWDIALAGHAYMIDLTEYERTTLDVIRQQADSSAVPSEQAFSPFSMWRRSLESWHHGAGQTNYDLADISDPARFSESKGVDPWTAGQIGMLPATREVLDSANSNLKLCVAGARIYVLDGQTTKFTTSLAGTPATWTSVTGTPAETPTSITTDGSRVWVAYPSGTWETNTGVSTASALGTQDADVVAYCNGRLVAAHDDVLYELDNVGATTTLFDHPHGTGFAFDCIALAPNGIYVAGHRGTTGEVYRVDITEATTALDNLFICASLPDGEYVTAMLHYVGVMVLGTNKGVRVASIDGNGNLNYGVLIPTTSAVQTLEGDDRFVWFGWSAYDSASSGLGRLDLAVFTDTLRPAYASDLMVTSQAAVVSCVTFGGARVFSVAGDGVYVESADKVASGTISSGAIRWGTTERKYVHSIDIRSFPLPAGASVAVSVAYDDGTLEGVSTLSTTGSTGPVAPFSTRSEAAEQVDITLTLNRATVTTVGPTILRSTVRALVAPPRTEQIVVPILLKDVVDANGQDEKCDVRVELDFLRATCQAGVPIVYQEGGYSELVVIEKVGFKPESFSGVEKQRRGLQGRAFVTLRTLEG